MYHNDVCGSEHQERRRAGLLAAALACLALAAAACSSAASPGAGAGPAGGGVSAKRSGLAFSRCMRAHGISDFPDPDSNGELGVSGGGDLTITNPKFQAAQKACQALMPFQLTPAQRAKVYSAGLKYAACMRGHGIINYPDPKPLGSGPATQQGGSQGGSGGSQNGTNGINPNTPRFIAADKACRHYMAGVPGAGPGTNSSGGGGGS
jgi:hypothetical protein